MEAYFEAKATLFTPEHAARASCSPTTRPGLASSNRPGSRCARCGAPTPSAPTSASAGAGSSGAAGRSRSRSTGRFNVDNALLVAEAAVDLGVEPDDVAVGLSEAPPVPGRMELVAADGTESAPTVLVDYAHTPAGLEGVLGAIGGLKRPGARTLVVFGCGGNRDQAKRPLMGRLAVGMADLVIVTSDNPRDEDPLLIIERDQDRHRHRRRPAGRGRSSNRTGAGPSSSPSKRAEPGDVVLIGRQGPRDPPRSSAAARPWPSTTGRWPKEVVGVLAMMEAGGVALLVSSWPPRLMIERFLRAAASASTSARTARPPTSSRPGRRPWAALAIVGAVIFGYFMGSHRTLR